MRSIAGLLQLCDIKNVIVINFDYDMVGELVGSSYRSIITDVEVFDPLIFGYPRKSYAVGGAALG